MILQNSDLLVELHSKYGGKDFAYVFRNRYFFSDQPADLKEPAGFDVLRYKLAVGFVYLFGFEILTFFVLLKEIPINVSVFAAQEVYDNSCRCNSYRLFVFIKKSYYNSLFISQ